MTLRLVLGVAIGIGLGALMGYFGKCSSGACPLTANPYRGAIYGGVMGLLFAFSLRGGQPTGATQPSSSGDASSSNVVHIATIEGFGRHILAAKEPVLADFYSDGCGPCRMLAPTIDKLAQKYGGQALVCKVSLDAAPELAQPHGIRGIPAVLFFDKGKEVQRLVGLKRQAAYEAVLDSMLAGQDQSTKEVPNANL